MRFRPSLLANRESLFPVNYQYLLSAAVYKIFQRADQDFAFFLHNKGYRRRPKSFKLFTFFDIRIPFERCGNRMLLTTSKAEFIVSFYLPVAAERFVQGLIKQQRLEIADDFSRTRPDLHNGMGMGA